MTITEKMYLSDVFSLDNKVVLSTISSQLTAHSSQLTAHSSQLTKSSFNQNNILFYNNKFINKKSSHRFVRIANSPMTALFLCLGRLCFAGELPHGLPLTNFNPKLHFNAGLTLDVSKPEKV